jgi:hypothetical protein
MNKRSRARFKTDLTVSVTCADLPGCKGKARLADLSVHGLSLILNNELHVGSLVKVEWGSVTFVGESVYCQPRGAEFLVGLKVEDPVYETAKSASINEPR